MKTRIKCSSSLQISENDKKQAMNEFVTFMNKRYDVYKFQPGQYGWFDDDDPHGMKFVDSYKVDWNKVLFPEGEKTTDPYDIINGIYYSAETIPDGSSLRLLLKYGYNEAADDFMDCLDELSEFKMR